MYGTPERCGARYSAPYICVHLSSFPVRHPSSLRPSTPTPSPLLFVVPATAVSPSSIHSHPQPFTIRGSSNCRLSFVHPRPPPALNCSWFQQLPSLLPPRALNLHSPIPPSQRHRRLKPPRPHDGHGHRGHHQRCHCSVSPKKKPPLSNGGAGSTSLCPPFRDGGTHAGARVRTARTKSGGGGQPRNSGRGRKDGGRQWTG